MEEVTLWVSLGDIPVFPMGIRIVTLPGHSHNTKSVCGS